MKKIKPLDKKQVIDAINGVSNPSRVPSIFSIWLPPYKMGYKLIKALRCTNKYPNDIKVFYTPSYLIPGLNGNNILIFDKKKNKKKALDESIELEDYKDIDTFIKRINDPNKVCIPRLPKSKQYRLGIFWNFLFESLWQIRGMENALTDFYLYPDEVHKLFRKITDFYKNLVVRSAQRAKIDGFFMSDDLGHQTGTFFSPEIFKEFFYPYYQEIIDEAHKNHIHFWLHTCGNVKEFMPMFIDLKLDVIHPIQKYAMDEVKIFNEYKDKICFLYGFDVQQIIPYGTSEDVREEVRRVYDLFSKAKGRLIFTSGNAINSNCPLDSYLALIEEAKKYNPYKQGGTQL